MLLEEISFIFLYVAAFGFSDFLVEKLKLKNVKYLTYYLCILILGISGLYYSRKQGIINDNNQEDDLVYV